MKQLITKNFIINHDENLQKFVEKTVKHAEDKKTEFYKIFKCKENEIDVLHASFFINREEFVEYIKSISNGQIPPSWATGCFYNGEIQVLVDLKNPEIKMNTLAHETMHLFFDKTIYQRYNIERVNWLDESFAVYLDGEPNDLSNEELKRIVEYLSKIAEGFDMKILEDYNKVKTEEYNGYDMFNIIGKYIFETKQEQFFLELIKNDRNKVVEIGKHILQDAIDYLKNKN
ncbi:MAG: hypothetical protein IJW36_00040 [Clostridia bacterium]|nr:hypothetical protein [Clostridia bacterium]